MTENDTCRCSISTRLPGNLLRVFFGMWLGYAGLMKFVGGLSNFVGFIQTNFAKTWIPAPLLTFTGYMIPFAEVTLGIWLVVGCCSRLAWLFTSLLMFLLTFGQTIVGANTVADNWFYVVLSLAGLATSSCRSSAGETPQEKAS